MYPTCNPKPTPKKGHCGVLLYENQKLKYQIKAVSANKKFPHKVTYPYAHYGDELININYEEGTYISEYGTGEIVGLYDVSKYSSFFNFVINFTIFLDFKIQKIGQ
jgi:hypothetical protein